jgi:hypothetical protein
MPGGGVGGRDTPESFQKAKRHLIKNQPGTSKGKPIMMSKKCGENNFAVAINPLIRSKLGTLPSLYILFVKFTKTLSLMERGPDEILDSLIIFR